MADYYPLLARALEALPDRSPALRKAVYDRARGALTAQLRSLDPPVAEADIELERKSLDGAIDRLETEYGEPPPAGEVATSPPVTPPPAPPAPSEPPAAPSLPEASAPPAAPEIPETLPEAEAPPAKPVEPSPPPAPAQPAPEPAPAEFVPFVPPPRKPKAAAAPAAPPVDPAPVEEPEPVVADVKPAEAPAAPSRRPRIEVVKPRAGRSRLLRNVVIGGVLLAVIGAIGSAAYVFRDRPVALPQGSDSEDAAQTEPQDQKFADRVGGENAEQPRRAPNVGTPQPDVTVAQRAVLYEENAADPKGSPKTTQGRVIWRLEPISGEQGQPLQSAVRALVEYPDAGFSLTMTIRKNLDATLPASHTIELAFASKSPGGEDRSVQEIGLPQLQEDQNVRGAPVAGLPVRVRDNLFLVGLSNLPSDIERNTALLTQKSWINIAVKFKSGPRAVLAIDKGTAGMQVVQSAFDQWRE